MIFPHTKLKPTVPYKTFIKDDKIPKQKKTTNAYISVHPLYMPSGFFRLKVQIQELP